MDNRSLHRMRRKLMGFRLYLVLVTAVLVAVVGIVSKYTEINFKNNTAKILAKVDGITEYGYPVLSYVVDEKEYRINSRYMIPDFKVGTEVEIEYHKEDPTFIQIGENPIYQSSTVMIILGTLGAIAAACVLHKRT